MANKAGFSDVEIFDSTSVFHKLEDYFVAIDLGGLKT